MANLERIVGWVFLASVFVFGLICRVSCDAEVDALIALKTNFTDPNSVLQGWDPNRHHCDWMYVTCNYQNSVTRVDLSNAGLSGQLVPQLAQLPNLQYLELYANNISGRIPEELGNLTNLVSLELYLNSLIGPIPPTLGKLSKLRFLRLNNNSLSGAIPVLLTTIFSLQVLDLSNNQLTGDIPINGSFSLFSPICFANNRLNQPPIPTTPTAASSGSWATKAIAGGVAAGAALLFAAPAIALALCLRRKPQDHFFDLKNIQKFIRDSLKGFLFMNYKLQQIILVIKTFWVEVDLVRFIKDA